MFKQIQLILFINIRALIPSMSIKQQIIPQSLSSEEQLRGLIKIRKQIIEKMSQLSKRRFFLEAQPKIKLSQQQNTQNLGQPKKMVKMDSCASISGVSDPQTPKKDERHRSSTILSKQQEQSETVRKINQEMAKRSRRMFQGLNQHLDKAKNKLQQQKTKREQTNKIIQKIQEKEKEKSEQLLREELQKIKTQYLHQQKLKSQNSKQILQIQNLILKNSYNQYANALKSFTFTKTEPPISWRPTNIQKAAKILLSERQNEIEQKNRRIIESIEKYENKFDYSLYLLQNQHQYYSNLLKNYYKELEQYCKTSNEPQIYWKSAHDSQKLEKLKSGQNKRVAAVTYRVIQILQKNRRECDEYYNEKIAILRQRRDKGHLDHEGQSHSLSPHHKQEQD